MPSAAPSTASCTASDTAPLSLLPSPFSLPLQAADAICCLVELGYCDDTDPSDWVEEQGGPVEEGDARSRSTAYPSQWADPLGVYVRLCDRLLQQQGAARRPQGSGGGDGGGEVHGMDIGNEGGGASRSNDDRSSTSKGTKAGGGRLVIRRVLDGSAVMMEGSHGRGVYVELALEVPELVHLARAVAKAGLGSHPVLNAISNSLDAQLSWLNNGG